MITFDYEVGRGVLANDYVIKNIRIFRKFLLNFGQIWSVIFKIFANSSLAILSNSLIHTPAGRI